MLLRRVTKHVVEQNWFAVFIDLLVVIIGIFLGMQVTDWAQYRLDRQAEKSYLERLSNDLSKDLNSLDDAIIVQQRRLDRARFLIDTTKNRALVVERPSYFVSSVQYAGYTYTPAIYDDTFEELKSAGKLPLLLDQELRATISGYYTLITRNSQWNYLRELVQTEYITRKTGVLDAEHHRVLSELPYDTAEFTREEAIQTYDRMMSKTEFVEFLPNTDFFFTILRSMERQKEYACDLKSQLQVAIGESPEVDICTKK